MKLPIVYIEMQYIVHHTGVVNVVGCTRYGVWIGQDYKSVFVGVLGDGSYYILTDIPNVVDCVSMWCYADVVEHSTYGVTLLIMGTRINIDFCNGDCCSLLRHYHSSEIARSVCAIGDFLFLRGVVIHRHN